MKIWNYFLLFGMFLPAALPFTPRTAEEQSAAKLRAILMDKRIWGKDFPATLVFLQTWQHIGESAVAVFPERIVGTTPYASREEALPQVNEMMREMLNAPQQLKPEFAPMMEQGAPGGQKAPEASVQRLSDDDTFRVVWTAPGEQFLRPALTLKQIEGWVGPAEKVTKQVIQSKGERRPVVLTLHRYANGAVTFVEWDLDPTPGLVNRALLNVPAITVEVLQEVR